MKVNIGPYLRYYGPYQIADLITYLGFSEDAAEKFGDWLTKIGVDNICERIYNLRSRRFDVVIHDHDVWDMDRTLAAIILPMLRKLKETAHGSPFLDVFSQTSTNWDQHCFDFYAEGDGLAWETGHSQWNDIMDKMIWSFEQLQPGVVWEDQFFENGYDETGYKEYAAKIQEGLDLFGKYYRNLWD